MRSRKGIKRLRRSNSRFHTIKKTFYISTEGELTERMYFLSFNDDETEVQIKCLKSKRSRNSPKAVLKRLRDNIKGEIGDGDEAWVVIDRDQWDEEHIEEVHQWTLKQTNKEKKSRRKKKKIYGLALSNPKFEMWLLLHFENISGISTARQYEEKLREYLPEYNKQIDMNKISREMTEKQLKELKPEIIRNLVSGRGHLA